MSVEISENQPPMELEKSTKENANQPADGHLVMNGISNGYEEKHIKKEHKSDRDKDRHKEKHKHKDKDRDRDRDKEKNKDKSSSGKEKEKHSGSSKDRDRDREKERDRDRDKDRERDKEKDREKKHKDEKRDKDREHKSSSSSKDKEHKSSSSSKDKEKHSSSSSSKDKDKDRHSSSHRDKEKERDKEKDKHSSSSKDKDKHHSSSNREKDRHSSSPDKKHSDKDKHRSKDKEKDRESKDKVKKPDEQKERKEKSEKNEVKTDIPVKTDELLQEVEKVVIKEEMLAEVKEEVQDEIGVGMSDSINDSLVNDTYEDTSVDISSFRIKSEEDTEDEVPLHGFTTVKSMRTPQVVKREVQEESDEDDVPLSARKKVKKEATVKKKKRKAESDEETFKPEKKKKMKTETKAKTESQTPESPRKGKKKEEQQQEVWKWWEEEKKDDGTKWNFLEHKGPVFAPPYERLPPDVKFFYDGKEMRLSEEAEEVATFYARMLDHDYTTKEAFNKNFFKDWRKMMTSEEKETITDLSKCNFKHMHAYFVQKSEERKAMSKEEKKKIKEQNEEIVKEYGFCVIDGHKERIGNFKIEPPGLFRGRGEHPKMGMLKRRVVPEDVIINCSKDSEIPRAPDGRKWKEVRHDKTVTWLASWTENVQGQVKYVMLNPSSKLKGEKDWQKYETARKLAKCIDKIRNEYREDWRSKEMRIRQRAVALYFIDKLALRAGNEKDEDQADTVGCCSLRVEHIQLHEEKDGKENVVVFDFLGKDSIRYYNEVSVEKRVFKNLQLFMQNKSTGDDLFDRLNTTVLNKHLNELMEGLTAKVFRTYNASITLQEQLKALTDPEYSVAEKILAYNRANRAVAILCNHQRAVPKTHAKSMENLKNKIETKREQVDEAERQYKQAKKEHKNHGTAKNKIDMDKRKKALDRLREQLAKLEVQATDKEENKEIALGTSKLNYLDPRISVAWCKKFDVPIERIYNKTQREKFRWAIDMAGPEYIF